MYCDGALGPSIASIDLSPMSINQFNDCRVHTVDSGTQPFVHCHLLPLFFSYKVAFYLKKFAP